jgi:hypothetical protein
VLLRSVVALLAIAFCLFAMQSAARFGFARLLGKYAVATHSIPAADQAVSLAPADAEVHRARARVLNRLQMRSEARKSFEIASSLRYRDDYLWQLRWLHLIRRSTGRRTMRTHFGNAAI